MNIKSSAALVKEALKSIRTISSEEAINIFNNKQCNLIDIREIGELEKEGRIDNSNHIPRSMLEFWLDPNSEYFKNSNIDIEKEIVLFCAGGVRSALAVKTLKDMSVKELNDKLTVSISEENYEFAARIRDEINKRN